MSYELPAVASGQRMATNQAASVPACATCGGDRFVVVGTRPVVQTAWMRERGITPPKGAAIEEYAPCPDCHSALDVSFWRSNGSQFTPPDPAKVREHIGG